MSAAHPGVVLIPLQSESERVEQEYIDSLRRNLKWTRCFMTDFEWEVELYARWPAYCRTQEPRNALSD